MTAIPPKSLSIFDRASALTFELEGRDKLSMDPHDPGNWTGGACGEGELRGTRWGFSAGAFPNLDIEHLDEPHATGVAFATFWLPAKCGSMPDALALLVYDAAFQHGVPKAVEMLQRALGLHVDGVIGTITQAAVHRACAGRGAVQDLCVAFQSERAKHMQEQPSWERDEADFNRRLFTTMQASSEVLQLTFGDAA